MVSLSTTSASYSSTAKTTLRRNSFTFAAVAGTSSNRRSVFCGKDGISKNGFGVLDYDTTSGVGEKVRRYMGMVYIIAKTGTIWWILRETLNFDIFYTCIDASDRIFDHCLSRSSEPTTPDLCVSTF